MRTAAFLSASLIAIATACTSDGGTTAPDVALRTQTTVDAGNDRGGAVYVLTNDVNANAILAYPRSSSGQLGAPARFPTGGRGTGGGLGNQYGLVLEDDMIFGVNAGSNEISSFRLDAESLRQADRVSSNGDLPISIAVHDKLLYVLNDGPNANITGFRVSPEGRLVPINGSTRARSAPAGAIDGAQISFSPDGRSLVVTEKAANLVVTYPVLANGRTAEPQVTVSSGATPFGFDFARNGSLVVSEAVGGAAGLSTVSSYRVDGTSHLSLVTASVSNAQSAVCWIVVSGDGRTAYAANTGSGTVSTFALGLAGALSLINPTAGAVGAGSSPSDMGLSDGDRFLYVRSGATNAIVAFETGENGTLTAVQTLTGVPTGANGIAVR
ncbi:MAG: beta-propeller fold lactonase family protein [Gemmatimonadota bacterium]